MTKNERITRVTAEQAAALRAEGRTDWARVHAMTQEEVDADAEREMAELGIVIDWSTAIVGLPEPKATVNMRIDRDILEFFRQGGRGYQTRINAVLRAYKDAQRTG